MKRTIILLLLFALASIMASAEGASPVDLLKEASTIQDDGMRLKAYDLILENAGLKEPFTVPSEAGSWYVDTSVDPLTDEEVVTFLLIAESGKSIYGKPIVLLVRCTKDKSDVFVAWGSYLGSEAYVTMRIDAHPAIRVAWSMSTDKTATFYPADDLDLIKIMLVAQRMVFQCTPYSESPITAVFDVRGLKDAASAYVSKLGWE